MLPFVKYGWWFRNPPQPPGMFCKNLGWTTNLNWLPCPGLCSCNSGFRFPTLWRGSLYWTAKGERTAETWWCSKASRALPSWSPKTWVTWRCWFFLGGKRVLLLYVIYLGLVNRCKYYVFFGVTNAFLGVGVSTDPCFSLFEPYLGWSDSLVDSNRGRWSVEAPKCLSFWRLELGPDLTSQLRYGLGKETGFREFVQKDECLDSCFFFSSVFFSPLGFLVKCNQTQESLSRLTWTVLKLIQPQSGPFGDFEGMMTGF